MAYNKIKIGSLCTVLVILVAIYYRNTNELLQKKLISVLQALENLENKHKITAVRPKVAIGYGICTDVYIEATKLLKYSKNIGPPKHFDEIKTKEELLQSFAYYFRYGAAAERFMPNKTLFDDLVTTARSYASSYSSIGGNAALMALRLVKEGCDVVLAAKMTKSLLQMIPDVVKVVGGEVDRDDIHLILEYKRGEIWGPYSSARANRFIIHNDLHNPAISSLEELDKVLLDFKPNLFIVSGLQMMDNYPYSEVARLKRLEKINEQMKKQDLSTKIHFEMASFSEEKLLLQLNEMILPYSDSLGMNEQEIVNLYNSLSYGNISLITNSTPRVASVLDQMRELFKLIRKKSENIQDSRKLSRIHVHTLAYQAIMTVKNSWKNTAAAAAKASLTAHRHVCSTTNIDLQKAALIMDDGFTTSIISGNRISLNADKPVSCWDEKFNINNEKIELNVCVAPVLVCTEAVQTAGGGDNVSSAGLVLQI